MTTGTLPIPAESRELTPDWLTAALRAGGSLPTGSVARTQSVRIAEGVGLLGQLFRITLELHGAPPDAPSQLIAKLPAASSENLAGAVALHFYQREVNFYRHLPSWAQLPIPRCYYAAVDGEGRRFVLLLEDLQTYTMGDQLRGANEKQVFEVLGVMARMHAQCWGRLSEAHSDWLIDPRAPFCAGLFQTMYREALPAILQRFAARFSPALRTAAESLTEYIPVFWQKMSASPTTLVHGDARLDNFMFGNESTRYSLAVLDFQVCMIGRGAYDVGYFMSQSVPTSARRRIEREALLHYYAVLGEHGVRDYSFDAFMLDFRRAVLYTLTYPVIACGHINPNDDRARAFGEQFLDRAMRTIEDTAAAEVLRET